VRGLTGRAVPGKAKRVRATRVLIEGSAAIEPETGRPVPSILESPPRAAG